VPGHIEMNALIELVRITKSNGYIVITVRDPEFEMNYMEEIGKVMNTKKVELLSMKLIPYKREYTTNYELTYGYLVTFKVL